MKQVTTQSAKADSPGVFVKREMHGTTFLALEHVLHKVLLVVLGTTIVWGLIAMYQDWVGKVTDSPVHAMGGMPAPMSVGMNHDVLMIVAVLVVAAPLVWVLQKRVQAELAKRPAFTTRLAYKVPLYSAVAAFFLLKFAAVIGMVWVVLQSLSMLGAAGADAGALFRDHFVPALIAAFVFAYAEWQLVQEAKGHTMGRMLTLAVVTAGTLLAVSLFTIATIDAQTVKTAPPAQQYLEDYLKDYNFPNDGSSGDYFKY